MSFNSKLCNIWNEVFCERLITELSGLVRFVPRGDKFAVFLGEPVDGELDVGIAVRNGDEVKVRVFSGTSVLEAGSVTDRVESIDRILSPLTMEEVGTIRCIGLNVSSPLYHWAKATPCSA